MGKKDKKNTKSKKDSGLVPVKTAQSIGRTLEKHLQGGDIAEFVEDWSKRGVDEIVDAIGKVALLHKESASLIGRLLLVIERHKKYIDAGFSSPEPFIRKVLKELGLPYSTMSDAMIEAKVYLKYKKQLDKAGFVFDGNATKLLHLETALKYNPAVLVFSKITNACLRDFVAFSKGSGPKPVFEAIEERVRRRVNKYLHLTDERIGEFKPPADELFREEIWRAFFAVICHYEKGYDSYTIAIHNDVERVMVDEYLEKIRKNYKREP